LSAADELPQCFEFGLSVRSTPKENKMSSTALLILVLKTLF
jgi:hypothetical protein